MAHTNMDPRLYLAILFCFVFFTLYLHTLSQSQNNDDVDLFATTYEIWVSELQKVEPSVRLVLFFWTVLLNRKDLAFLFLREIDDSIGKVHIPPLHSN